jgi:hypothetical protein
MEAFCRSSDYYEVLAIIRASATFVYEFRLMLYTRQTGRRLLSWATIRP